MKTRKLVFYAQVDITFMAESAMKPAQMTLFHMKALKPAKVNYQSDFLLIVIIFPPKLECQYGYRPVRSLFIKICLISTRTYRTFAWTAPQSAISFLLVIYAHNVLLAALLARELVATSVFLAFRDHTTYSHPRTLISVLRLVHSDTARMTPQRLVFNVWSQRFGTIACV